MKRRDPNGPNYPRYWRNRRTRKAYREARAVIACMGTWRTTGFIDEFHARIAAPKQSQRMARIVEMPAGGELRP